jgi:hypothetical protein
VAHVANYKNATTNKNTNSRHNENKINKNTKCAHICRMLL